MNVNTQELRALIAYHNRSQKDIAETIGLSRNTFMLKLRSGDFKISEIHRLMKAVPMNLQEVEKIFFSE